MAEETEETQSLEGLGLQLAEVEMLTSMYSLPGEFVLDNIALPSIIQKVVNGELSLDALDSRLGFNLNIGVAGKGKTLTVELVCLLPHKYPFVKPQIFTRSPDLSKEMHKQIRDDLNKELDSLEEGDIVIGVLAEWLRERLYTELQNMKIEPTPQDQAKKQSESGRDSVTRMWIYSHHIFSKTKRQDILSYGQELKLHGFCMPGKPGIICAEGDTCDVEEFWSRIRRLSWKKISIKSQEVIPLTDTKKSSVLKFDPFFELLLDARGGKGREYHMDLGQFSTYLQDHDSSDAFNLFFGLDSKQGDDVD